MAVVFGGGSRKSLALVLATSQLLACSFIAEPPPGSAHELRPDRDGYACGRSFLYPVADTISTGASITWIVRANDELDTHRRDSEGDRWRFARVAGWVSLGVFGASAIYGYFVEGRCARIRKERELAKTLPPAATRRAFPSSVFGFGFRRQRAELAQVCVSKDAQWSMEGTVARCRPRNESVPEVRIAFELGVSSEIRTVFVGAAAAENRDYQSLADGLRKFYGPPDAAR